VLGEGGFNVVAQIEHAGIEEVALRYSIDKKDSNPNIEDIFLESIKETAMLKLCLNEQTHCKVIEEIILYRKIGTQCEIVAYAAIVERANYSFHDLPEIWLNEESRVTYCEHFSPEKLTYCFYKIMLSVHYMH
jgi:hypothetical protein